MANPARNSRTIRTVSSSSDLDRSRSVYIGGIFEKNTTTGEVTKYYFAGGQRVEMRKSTPPDTEGQVFYFANDHLSGTATVMDASGGLVSHTRYYPYGMVWTQEGATPTDKMFTGHQRESNPGGTYYAGARFYSADIGRFVSADTMVPNASNPQELNRYSYVTNNPLKYNDPTGHIGIGVMPGPDFGGGGSRHLITLEALSFVGMYRPAANPDDACWNKYWGECDGVNDQWVQNTRWAADILSSQIGLDELPWHSDQRIYLWEAGYTIDPRVFMFVQEVLEKKWWSLALPAALGIGGLSSGGSKLFLNANEMLSGLYFNAIKEGVYGSDFTLTVDKIGPGKGKYDGYVSLRGNAYFRGAGPIRFHALVTGNPLSGYLGLGSFPYHSNLRLRWYWGNFFK